MKAAAAVWVTAIAAWSAGSGSRAPTDGRAHDFGHDVLPMLQRLGCASAYCHGGGTGQGGFKLSLFGSDPAADYAAITTEFGGRRLDLDAPDASLLLQKALGKLDHGGGRVLPRESALHERLRGWIGAGAPWRHADAGEVAELQLARTGDRLVAVALIGGRPVDVSDRALFSSTAPDLLEVTADGECRQLAAGRAFAIARFGLTTAALPFVQPLDVVAPTHAVLPAHGLDRAFVAHLGELGLVPAPPVDAAALARRLWLDLVARPPTPHELATFVAAPDVAATVWRLCARREWAEVWGAHLARWFELPPAAVAARERLVAALARGDDLRAIAARAADGDLAVWAHHADPRDRAEHAARALLGVRIGCARCHDHPDDRWTRREHQAWSAAFAPARAAPGGVMAAGMLFDDDSGQPVPPSWLQLPGSTVAADASLGEFVLDPGHGQLARHLANRVFAELIGRGVVDPVDDHRPSNPPLHAGMLQALTAEFTRSQGRLADLLVFVATSRIYAMQTVPPGDARARWLAATVGRRLGEPTFARALGAVLGKDVRGALPTEPLARELALRNGAFVHGALAAGGTTVDALFEFGGSPRERLDELWRTLLSRPPRADEVALCLAAASGDGDAFRDLAAAVLCGREFGERR